MFYQTNRKSHKIGFTQNKHCHWIHHSLLPEDREIENFYWYEPKGAQVKLY